MTESEIMERLERANKRHRALGGNGFSIVIADGRWSITTAGGSPRAYGSGYDAKAGFEAVERDLASLERKSDNLAATLGIAS